MSQNTQYVAANERLPVLRTKMVSHNPTNGGVFGPSNKRINFRIPPEEGTFLDGDDLRLAFDFQFKSSSDSAENYYPFMKAGSSNSLIDSIEVKVGQETIEIVESYARTRAVLEPLYVDPFQSVTSGNVEDPVKCTAFEWTEIVYGQGSVPSTNLVNGATLAKKYTGPLISVSLPLILNTIGAAQKVSFPLTFCKHDLHVNINLVDNINRAIYGALKLVESAYNADATFIVTNVRLICKHVTYGPEVIDEMRRISGKELVYDGMQNITANSGAISYASAGQQDFILPNCQFSNLLNVTQSHYVSPTTTGDDIAYQPALQVVNSRLSIGGNYVNNRGLSFGNAGATEADAQQNVSEFAMSAFYSNRRIVDVDDINTSLRATTLGFGSAITVTGWGPNLLGAENPSASVTKASYNNGTASDLVTAQFKKFFTSHNISDAQFEGRLRQGKNTINQEVVLQNNYQNTSSSTVPVYNHYIYLVNVKYILDMELGTMRTEY